MRHPCILGMLSLSLEAYYLYRSIFHYSNNSRGSRTTWRNAVRPSHQHVCISLPIPFNCLLSSSEMIFATEPVIGSLAMSIPGSNTASRDSEPLDEIEVCMLKRLHLCIASLRSFLMTRGWSFLDPKRRITTYERPSILTHLRPSRSLQP